MIDAALVEKKLAFIETRVREFRELARPERMLDDVRETPFRPVIRYSPASPLNGGVSRRGAPVVQVVIDLPSGGIHARLADNMSSKTTYVPLFWFALVGLLIASLVPDISINRNVYSLGITIRADIVLHYAGFTLLGWLYGRSYSVTVKSVALLVVFAVLHEAIQYFVSGRAVHGMDLLSNVLGLATGLLLVVINGFRARPTV